MDDTGGSTVTTHYYYDKQNVVEEYDGPGSSDNLVASYVFGPRIDEIVMMDRNAGGDMSWFYHHDLLGSVVNVTDNAGTPNVAERYIYDVFGNVTIYAPDGSTTRNNTANPYLYASRRYDQFDSTDSTKGHYHYRARTYDARAGRFLTRDPLLRSPRAVIGEGANLYAYAGNNPANAVDPYGLAEKKLVEKAWWYFEATIDDHHIVHQTLMKTEIWFKIGIWEEKDEKKCTKKYNTVMTSFKPFKPRFPAGDDNFDQAFSLSVDVMAKDGKADRVGDWISADLWTSLSTTGKKEVSLKTVAAGLGKAIENNATDVEWKTLGMGASKLAAAVPEGAGQGKLDSTQELRTFYWYANADREIKSNKGNGHVQRGLGHNKSGTWVVQEEYINNPSLDFPTFIGTGVGWLTGWATEGEMHLKMHPVKFQKSK